MTVCEVFPPGTPDYEAMASLGRMVAQCGPGIEEVVKQRKPQDPNLWYAGILSARGSSPKQLTLLFPYHFYSFEENIDLLYLFLLISLYK